LAFADPMAAIIGRRFGRIRLVNGRSLEGSLTFIVTGFVAAITVLAIYYPEVSWGAKAALALGGAIPSAVAELVSRRIDDNLSIPLSAGAGALAMVYWLGIA
jgi:dolichol kinase